MSCQSSLVILLTIAISFPVDAGDWPQILGPDRNGIAEGETLGDWNHKLETAWEFDCGSGFSGVAVAKGKVFLFHRLDDREVLNCLDATSGKNLWETRFPAIYREGYNSDLGPRCVPTVQPSEDSDVPLEPGSSQVVVYGAGGSLHSVDASNGKTLWSRELRADYAADDGYFGAGSSPIVSSRTVVVAVGGIEGAGVVGVDRIDGKTKWKALNLEADYASPIALDKETVIVPMRMKTVILDSSSGKVRHEIDFGQRGLNVIGATPVLIGTDLLLSASYRIGAQLVDLDNDLKVKWNRDDALSSQYASGVAIDRHVFGCHGREDMGLAELRCIEATTGDVCWARDGYGVAHVIGTKKRLIAQTVDGGLELFEASAERFKSLGKHRLPSGTYRAVPALSGGLLFCRSTDRGRGKLIAIRLPK